MFSCVLICSFVTAVLFNVQEHRLGLCEKRVVMRIFGCPVEAVVGEWKITSVCRTLKL